MIALFCLAVVVLWIASTWIVFTKAGKPGWAAIIPIYNLYVITEIVGRPWWFLLLMLIPIANLIVGIILHIDLAKSFNQGTGFGLGLFFLGFIFFPLLAFGDAQYAGPSAANA